MSNLHVAIIMDGNGRWATRRGWPRIAGHRAGADAVRRTVEAAPDLGVGMLTLYAFSSDNWKRPAGEVNALMRLLDSYLRRETERCVKEGVRVEIIGRRDRIAPLLASRIAETEAATAAGRKLHLRIALDYSSRQAILDAASRLGGRTASPETFSKLLGARDVDLVIRTSGEQRLSDFLLWECAYAELVSTSRMWPDFDRGDLESALAAFASRSRRFGAVPATAAG